MRSSLSKLSAVNSKFCLVDITVDITEPIYAKIQYSAVQYSTVQYTTVQYSTVRYTTVQYSKIPCSEVKFSAVQCGTNQIRISLCNIILGVAISWMFVISLFIFIISF